MQAFWQLHDFFFSFSFLKSCWFIFTSHDTKSGATQAVIHNEGSSFISVSWENLSFKQSDHSVVLSALCCCYSRLTERVGAVGAGRRRRLFGVQCIGKARSLVSACEGVQGWFARAGASGGATGGMQTSGGGGRRRGMRGKLLLLHQQRLVQLTLVLLDLLLHVGDCTCNLGEKRRTVIIMYFKRKHWEI